MNNSENGTKGSDELQLLKEKVDKLEDEIKEKEISVLRAIRTLFTDLIAWRNGRREEFPWPAVIGFTFAYIRPRAILVLGSIAAIVFAAAQLVVLVRQNTLIERQNDLFESEKHSQQLEMLTDVILKINSTDDAQKQVASSALGMLGDDLDETGVDMLLESHRIGGRTIDTQQIEEFDDSAFRQTVRLVLLESAEKQEPGRFSKIHSLIYRAALRNLRTIEEQEDGFVENLLFSQNQGDALSRYYAERFSDLQLLYRKIDDSKHADSLCAGDGRLLVLASFYQRIERYLGWSNIWNEERYQSRVRSALQDIDRFYSRICGIGSQRDDPTISALIYDDPNADSDRLSTANEAYAKLRKIIETNADRVRP